MGSTSCPWLLCSSMWADAKIPLVPSLAGRWICSAGQLWAVQALVGKLQVSLLCEVRVCWVGWAQLWLCSPASRASRTQKVEHVQPCQTFNLFTRTTHLTAGICILPMF